MIINNREKNEAAAEGWAYHVYNLEWTTTPPTEPGTYWAMLDEPVTVSVRREAFTNELFVVHPGNEVEFPLSDYTDWLGPIPAPEPPQKGN